MMKSLSPVLHPIGNLIRNIRLTVLDWHLSQLPLEAPFRGELLFKRQRIAQGRLFRLPTVLKIGRLQIEIRWLPA